MEERAGADEILGSRGEDRLHMLNLKISNMRALLSYIKHGKFDSEACLQSKIRNRWIPQKYCRAYNAYQIPKVVVPRRLQSCITVLVSWVLLLLRRGRVLCYFGLSMFRNKSSM